MKKNLARNYSFYMTFIILSVFAIGVPASADYTISPLSDGLSSKTVLPGESFDLEIVLASDGSDVHDSAIFQVVFSKPGLAYQSYDWKDPYVDGTDDDDSTPIIGDLPLILDADTLSGAGYPAGAVDIELSNTADDDFGVGILTTLTLQVPGDWSPIPDSVLISIVPDTFADGFATIPTTAGQEFTLNIPEPASLGLLAIGSLAAFRRKRRQV